MPGDAFLHQYGGVIVSWHPEERLLRMRHGPVPQLTDHTAWTLGCQVERWIAGLEGHVAAIVDASGVPALPDDWRDYWIKALRRGSLKGLAVHGATRAFARTAADVARLARIPFALAADDAACAAFLARLPPVPPAPGPRFPR